MKLLLVVISFGTQIALNEVRIHIYLFIAAIATLVFLWLPYTLLLLFMQSLRRASHLRPLKWIDKFAPVCDAYFSPLKDKYGYWFGTIIN